MPGRAEPVGFVVAAQRRDGAGRRWRVALLGLLFAGGVALTLIAPWRDLKGTVRGELIETRLARYSDDFIAAGREFELDPYLLGALAYHESSGRPDAVSPADALGLVQLKLATARERARILGIEEPDRDDLLSDAGLNLRLGAAYLAYLVGRQDGSVERALMAYNAGPTKFGRWLRDAGGYAAWRAARDAEGPPAYGSVRAFSARVIATADDLRAMRLFD